MSKCFTYISSWSGLHLIQNPTPYSKTFVHFILDWVTYHPEPYILFEKLRISHPGLGNISSGILHLIQKALCTSHPGLGYISFRTQHFIQKPTSYAKGYVYVILDWATFDPEPYTLFKNLRAPHPELGYISSTLHLIKKLTYILSRTLHLMQKATSNPEHFSQ